MKPPLELNRPTILNIVAIVCYCLAILFHIIAYATNSWASLVLKGVRWEMGLWQGCRQTDDGGWYCTTDVFQDDVFQTGSDWHTGSQIMMTLALVILFFLEFALLGYVCIHRFQKYKSKLVGFVIGLSVSAVLFQLITLIVYRQGIKSHQAEVRFGSAFGFTIFALLIEICMPWVIGMAICKRYHIDQLRLVNMMKLCGCSTQRESYSTLTTRSGTIGNVSTIERESMETSVTSLSEEETFHRFAYTDRVLPHNSYLGPEGHVGNAVESMV